MQFFPSAQTQRAGEDEKNEKLVNLQLKDSINQF